MATPGKQSNALALIHKQESRHSKVPTSVLRAVLGRMQLTFHATRRTPHGASRLVQAMSAWLVKTRRAPSRYRRGARIYGHTTKAMHKLSIPPPRAPPPCFFLVHLCSLRVLGMLLGGRGDQSAQERAPVYGLHPRHRRCCVRPIGTGIGGDGGLGYPCWGVVCVGVFGKRVGVGF